ncbi:ATP-dependent zinc protease family protein [Photobacterium leiognathi]|uniref:ATP-dependent zinc protease family protein n=1 Tax=Photobacterium leiognathi TaxID=553611 RepID=UPI003D9FCD1E
MLRFSVPLLTLAILTGCSTTQPQDHQETMAAINNVEQNINTKFDSVSTRMDSQQQYIAELENKLASISKNLKFIKQKSLVKPKVIVEKQIVRVPVEPKIEANPTQANGKAILGQEEWVWIDSVKSFFKARVDTGATTSSLNAIDVQTFERDGKEWVRFNLSHNSAEDTPAEKAQNDKATPETIEAPIVRWVRIRQSTSEEAVRRPVIEAWITLGSLHEKAQFTLADRTKMDFPVLLGREFFKDIALVDVGKQFVQGKTEPKPEPVSANK